MLERLFRLKDHQTTVKIEIISGVTTFLIMMYILFVNGTVLSKAGMPVQGVFVATALTAAVSTLLLAFFSNVPFAMAPGMGMNSLFVHTICIGMGYHWKEALAISFIAGILHVFIILSPFRKSFILAIPEHLRIAAGAGLGMFIAYLAIRNAGLMTFTIPSTEYLRIGKDVIVTSSTAVPSLIKAFGTQQVIAIAAMVILLILLALEQKSGEQYGALPISIMAATLIGIPLNIAMLQTGNTASASAFDEFRTIFLSFFGSPGLGSLFRTPAISLRTLLMVLVLSMTTVLDSVGTMIGLGHIDNARVFSQQDVEAFRSRGTRSRMDKTLICNSIGNVIAPLLGTSPSVIYLESVTGVLSGGRTGLTGVVVGLLFLLCLPIAGFFRIIPIEAVAPAMLFAGGSMMTQLRYIDWKNIEESIPAFMIMLFIPLTYSILDGIAIGIFAYVVIEIALGKVKKVHPILHCVTLVYILSKIAQSIL